MELDLITLNMEDGEYIARYDADDGAHEVRAQTMGELMEMLCAVAA